MHSNKNFISCFEVFHATRLHKNILCKNVFQNFFTEKDPPETPQEPASNSRFFFVYLRPGVKRYVKCSTTWEPNSRHNSARWTYFLHRDKPGREKRYSHLFVLKKCWVLCLVGLFLAKIWG